MAGLNFHGGLGVCDAPLCNGKFQIYTPICAANTADESAEIYLAIRFTGSRTGTGATVVHLTGDSLASARGVIQGVSVDRNGRLPYRPATKLHFRDGTLSLAIASGSADLITL